MDDVPHHSYTDTTFTTCLQHQIRQRNMQASSVFPFTLSASIR